MKRIIVLLMYICTLPLVFTDENANKKIEKLEEKIELLIEELRELKSSKVEEQKQMTEMSEQITKLKEKKVESSSRDLREEVRSILNEEIPANARASIFDSFSSFNRFSFGGYGDFSANFQEGNDNDFSDIHRLVFYIGYQFSDWIMLHSEIEIEHSFVNKDSGGELVIEQLHLDFALDPAINARIGRILIPVGYINHHHEPTSFNGVERSLFDTFIIPSTWSADGVGIFGQPLPWLSYEAYVVSGLDGSQFNAVKGIRDGRIKERPSLNEAALTMRIDISPELSSYLGDAFRLGLSMYYGGLDNGNKGVNPGLDADLQIYAVDFTYLAFGRLEIRGNFAYEHINGAREIGNGVAEGIMGGNVELALRVMPESWKTGRFRKSELVIFGRYDYVDTQHKLPSGIQRDKAGTREEVTFGFTFFFQANLALKADVQLRNDDNEGDLDTLYNFGLAWVF